MKSLVDPSRKLGSRSLSDLPKLGVGVLDNASLIDFYASDIDSLDYISIIPDTLRTDKGPAHSPRFVNIDVWINLIDELSKKRSVIAHSIGLSIGSAQPLDIEYVEQIEQWNRLYKFPWHSDHLSFIQVPGASAHDEHSAGLAVPIPYDYEVLDFIASRVQTIQKTVSCPFLLENNVYYIDFPNQEMTEPEFLNSIARNTGCGILLDVHNLYTNSINHHFRASDFIAQLDLSNVVEIHIAGGNELAGMYTDSHAGPCPEPVWQLLEEIVPQAENLCGITFEFHESYYPMLEAQGVRRELDRAKSIWSRSHSVS